MRITRILAAQLSLHAFFVATIYLAEGAAGFKPFLNLEALLLVVVGTASLTWCSKLPDDDLPTLIRAARDRALALGGLGSLFGLILLLSSIDDVSALPRRLALALTSLFYGLYLSEVLLAPFERPSKTEPTDARGRLTLAGLIGAVLLFGMMAVLYSLSAALAPRSCPHGERLKGRNRLNTSYESRIQKEVLDNAAGPGLARTTSFDANASLRF